jgi:hypothetical protein
MAEQSRGLFGQRGFGNYSGSYGGVPVPMTPEEIQYQLSKQGLQDYENLYANKYESPESSAFNVNVNSRYRARLTNSYIDSPPDLEPLARFEEPKSKVINDLNVIPPKPSGFEDFIDENGNAYTYKWNPNVANYEGGVGDWSITPIKNVTAQPPVTQLPAPALAPTPAPALSAPTSVLGMFPEVEAMQRALYQQKQNEAMQAQALQFAKLDPFQKASYGLAMGGQQLGDAIGGALGAKDPQLQMIAQRQQMLGMIDPNKPETYGRAIQFALQTGDSNTAQMLNNEMKNAQARKTENLQLGLQKLAQTLYKPDGSIDENVYATLQSYGAVGQAVIDQQAKGFQGLQTQKVQSLGRQLFNKDGSRNKEVEKQLQATPEGIAILKQFVPETKVFKRGDIITEQNPVTGDWEVKTPTGLKAVSAGANPIKAMIDTQAIDPTVNAYATEIANQWDNLDDKGRSDSLESLTKVNNQALDRAQKRAETNVGGSDKVQSSKVTPDGTTIVVMKNGTTKVISSQGDVLTGQSRTDAIKNSEDFGADVQERRAQGRGIGELSAKQVGQAFAEVGKIKKNLGNIDDAIAAIDAGANTGVIASKLPNITAASVQLANVRQQLGLDVIGSVTFGALSEGELNLALDTSLPMGLAPKDLRAYLVNKKTAQTKLAGYLTEQATYLSKRGNTLAGWLEKVDNKANAAQSEIPAGVVVRKK